MLIRVAKAEALQAKAPPPILPVDPFSLVSESELFRGLVDQLKL